MIKSSKYIVAALVAVAFTSEVRADLTGSLETQAVSNYTYHGRVLDSNPVFVPKLSLQAPVFTGGSLQFSTEQILGTKGSTYYRTQYNAGLALTHGRFVVTPGFQVDAFPERDAKNSQSVTARVSFDDTGLLPLSLRPTLAFEKAVDPKGGNWYELSVSPGQTNGKWTVTVPLAVGVGSNSYYTSTDKDVHYAYASAGLSASYQVTDRFSVKAGSAYYNTDSKVGNSKNSFLSSNLGVAVSF